MPQTPESFEDYLAPLTPEKQSMLRELQRVVLEVAPAAVECISYQLPTFRLHGRSLVSIGAAARHCALYPCNSHTVAQFAEQLAGYGTSKGAIRFPVGEPLPLELIRKIVEARVLENEAIRR